MTGGAVAGEWHGDAGGPRRSPLHDRHVTLGARMGDFAGWAMPLEYAGGGVGAEHAAVRERVGVFDVSHLGKLEVTGPGARDALNAVLTNDLGRVGAGGAQYTLLCSPDGGVVDDMIAYVRGPAAVMLVPNAANAAAVRALLAASVPAAVADRHTDLAVLAVQGPESAAVLADLALPHDMAYMGFTEAGRAGERVVVCRTGYTGERGYELVVPVTAAAPLWDALLEAALSRGGRACGLGARDTLRTEMGYPLHGQDVGPGITPVQAGLSWAVGWSKPVFAGRDALVAEREAGPRRRLVGLVCVDRGVPRPGMVLRIDPSGPAVGRLTSGTFSPTLRTGVALALVDTAAGLDEDAVVVVDVRGRPCRARMQRPPFVPSRVR